MKNVKALFALMVVLSMNIVNAKSVERAGIGEFEITVQDGSKQKALLLDTSISGEVNGLVASITIQQSFSNQTNEWAHGRYVFPLPDGAAVNALQIKIGHRIIEGEVKEKRLAKQSFAAAKKAGKKAGLLEQHRANLFSVNIANIAPGETMTTSLTYIDRVTFKNNLFELVIPTTLTPRYITGQAIDLELKEVSDSPPLQVIDNHSGWANNTNAVKDASAITPPQTYAPQQLESHQFDLRLKIDPGLPSNGIDSPSHTLNSNFLTSNGIEISLGDGKARLDRDLILQWQLRDQSATQAAIFKQKSADSNDRFSMIMVTPPSANIQAIPRDITFIIDTSGSMGGVSIEQAKLSLLHALDDLSVNDRFNVIEFNSRFNPLFRGSRMASEQHLSIAKAMVNRLTADGGTEMLGALGFALNQTADTGYLRQIVFITDGSIGNEQELFKLINDQLDDARLYTVSIGSAPNSYFMRKAAKFGRGFYVHISRLDEVKNKIALLSEKIRRPVMRNIHVTWPGAVEHYPQKLPDLYAGEPLLLLARSNKPFESMTISGELDGQRWSQKLVSASSVSDQENASHLNTLWSRAKVESLMDSLVASPENIPTVKQQVIDLGTRYNLVTKFTSFIAVEKEVTRPSGEKAKHENVPNLMPHGSTMQAPATATSAQLLQLLGLLLLMMALVCKTAPGYRWPAEIS